MAGETERQEDTCCRGRGHTADQGATSCQWLCYPEVQELYKGVLGNKEEMPTLAVGGKTCFRNITGMIGALHPARLIGEKG
jgi:hypothetical protein